MRIVGSVVPTKVLLKFGGLCEISLQKWVAALDLGSLREGWNFEDSFSGVPHESAMAKYLS